MKRKSPLAGADNTGAMTTTAPNAYLRNAVMTATPEQLQLMLYDGAIRFATQGRDALEVKNYEVSFERLNRAQKIVLEMQSGLNHDVNPSLCAQMASLYDFVYRKLVDACIEHDVTAVDDALKILHHQRETWVMLIDRLTQEARGASGGDAPPVLAVQQADLEQDGEHSSVLCVEG